MKNVCTHTHTPPKVANHERDALGRTASLISNNQKWCYVFLLTSRYEHTCFHFDLGDHLGLKTSVGDILLSVVPTSDGSETDRSCVSCPAPLPLANTRTFGTAETKTRMLLFRELWLSPQAA